MMHNRYLKNRFAAVVAIATVATIAMNAYANLPFHALDPPDSGFKTYVTAIQRRKHR
ncbi:MAG: hypothetical protein J6A19_12085 [Oscillospiraceae bacterium]|nr:hypothetical protein [Oscillospiraceae bacterium]